MKVRLCFEIKFLNWLISHDIDLENGDGIEMRSIRSLWVSLHHLFHLMRSTVIADCKWADSKGQRSHDVSAVLNRSASLVYSNLYGEHLLRELNGLSEVVNGGCRAVVGEDVLRGASREGEVGDLLCGALDAVLDAVLDDVLSDVSGMV